MKKFIYNYCGYLLIGAYTIIMMTLSILTFIDIDIDKATGFLVLSFILLLFLRPIIEFFMRLQKKTRKLLETEKRKNEKNDIEIQNKLFKEFGEF